LPISLLYQRTYSIRKLQIYNPKAKILHPKVISTSKKNKQHNNKQRQQPKIQHSPTAQPESLSNVQPESELPKTEDELIDEKIAAAQVLTLKDSLFDRHQSSDFDSNLRYMTRQFGFFIPEIEYIKDLQGLIVYLGQKISIGNTCIYCEKTFYSLDATRDHMRSVSHCKILWEDNEEEYADYYDLEAANRRFGIPTPDGEESDNNNVYLSKNNELVIADKNKVVGHRALQVYYKQRHNNSSHYQLITSLMQEHKRLAAIEKQRNLNLPRKALNAKSDWSLKLGMKNNNQARYRNQNPI